MPVPDLWKPWFVYRPGQLVRRAVRAVVRPRSPVQTVELPWGCRLTVDTRETIGRSVWHTGVYDLAVVEVLMRLARADELSLDVGANIGAMAGALAARSAEVWAFEPHPDVFARLTANLGWLDGRPGFAPCRAFRLALAAADGTASLECPGGFADNHGLARLADGPGLSVETARLDRLLGGRPVGVLKLDVEGGEAAVLDGAADAVAAGRIRHIVFEDHTGPGGEVIRRLRAAGYAVFEIGWRMRGPVLADPGAGVGRAYQPPNYLATRDRAAAEEACRRPGWECLTGRAGRPTRSRPAPPGGSGGPGGGRWSW
jgi:FkbM family methyltransferase